MKSRPDTAANMETIEQNVIINAKPEDVYDAILDPEIHSEFTQAKATNDMKVGGKFTAYDDYISGINLKLAEFSLNHALQEDERFDEVGPAGQILWCLRRLEPEGVREVPASLHYSRIEYDRSVLDDAMKKLEAQLDDELSDPDGS